VHDIQAAQNPAAQQYNGNPCTGAPSESDVVSTTIIADKGIDCDALSTGLVPSVMTFPPRLIRAEVTPSSSSTFFISSEIYPFATAPKFSVTASLEKERELLCTS